MNNAGKLALGCGAICAFFCCFLVVILSGHRDAWTVTIENRTSVELRLVANESGAILCRPGETLTWPSMVYRPSEAMFLALGPDGRRRSPRNVTYHKPFMMFGDAVLEIVY